MPKHDHHLAPAPFPSLDSDWPFMPASLLRATALLSSCLAGLHCAALKSTVGLHI